jgi:hypothetical protein
MATSEAKTKRVQALSTVLLAVAAVVTAWCSFQSSRWNAEYHLASGKSSSIRAEAIRAQGQAETEKQADLLTFTQWVNAYSLKRTQLAHFYLRRFRTEAQPAVLAWLKTEPLTNPAAPLSPFVMPQYKLAAAKNARELDAEGELSSATGHRAIQRTTNYLLAVVLCSGALFFAGISKVGGSLRQQEVLLGIGWALFLGAFVWVATSPVSFSV